MPSEQDAPAQPTRRGGALLLVLACILTVLGVAVAAAATFVFRVMYHPWAGEDDPAFISLLVPVLVAVVALAVPVVVTVRVVRPRRRWVVAVIAVAAMVYFGALFSLIP